MAADPSVFGQYLQQPRSALDYASDLDKRDLNALQLIAQRRQNELAGLQADQTRAQLGDAAAKRNALAQLYGDPAMRGDPMAMETALLSDPRLVGEGQAMRKSRLDAAHLEAQTGQATAAGKKSGAEAAGLEYRQRIEKADRALRDIAAFQHPGQALSDLQTKVQAGEVPAEQAQMIAQQLQSIQTPQQWSEWQRSMRYRILDAKDQLEQEWKAREFGLKGANEVMTPDGRGGFVVNRPLVGAKSAIAQAGATQVPGMTYMTDSSGNIVGLPTKAPLGRTVVANVVTDANRVPLPGKDGGMTEDQGKAAGWLVQATNAFANMSNVIKADPSAMTPGAADVVAAVPGLSGIGNAMRSEGRQKFNQSASSLSEALLRAATGAGVNRDEAAQKIQELTPVWGEKPGATQQKLDAIPLYIESLKARAGRAGTKAAGQALDASGVAAPTQPPGGSPRVPAISSDAEYNALPSGSTFVGPDGKTRRKP